MTPELYCGIMSGTSLDGIDATICEFAEDKVTVHGAFSLPWPKELREILLSLASEETVPMDVLARTHFLLAKYYFEAAKGAIEVSGGTIRAIGLHGQTIRHLPNPESLMKGLPKTAATIQLGSGSALAAISGIDVISDFRSADVAVGGQGAPLVPMFDFAFLRSKTVDRLVVNIGGISNVTWLPVGIEPNEVLAFDCGPGNMLMDSLSVKYYGLPFDEDGHIAREGEVDNEVLEELLSHPYFSTPPPKSTGRELFGENFLKAFTEKIERGKLKIEDALRTACELTARSITHSIRVAKKKTSRENALEIVISGGGAKNSFLMKRIATGAPKANVISSASIGIDPQQKESIAFAYFAKAFVHNELIHLPSTTGAAKRVMLGSLSKGQTS